MPKSLTPRLLNVQVHAKLLALASLASLSAACTTLPSFSSNNYVNPIDGAAVVENKTRYSEALECLRPQMTQGFLQKRRFAVGRVNDFTGKEDLTNGKRITQGAALMVISALSKAGVPLVERFDTSVADMELKYADNKLISDSLVTEPNSFRKIYSGSLLGSDYHIVGGITEVNYNIRSGSLESSIRFIGASARYFVMNIAVDLRVVNTKTLEVVNTQSLQKQIIGTELSGGYFRIFSDGLVDVTASERTQEPIQKGVRMVIEQAVFNILSEMNQSKASHCLPTTMAGYLGEDPNARAPAPTDNLAARRQANKLAASNPAIGNTGLNNPGSNRPGITEAAGGAQLAVDPNTGEVFQVSKPSSTKATTLANTPREETRLKGLFGSPADNQNSRTAEEEAEAANKQVMQEKMLWGSRPTIR